MSADEAKLEKQDKRRAAKAAGQEKKDAPFRGFINATPSESDKADFQGWLSEDDLFSEAVDDALSRGYKFTITYEEKGAYYRATAATWDGRDANAGLVLSLRARDGLRALARCVWWLSRKKAYQLDADDASDPEADVW